MPVAAALAPPTGCARRQAPRAGALYRGGIGAQAEDGAARRAEIPRIEALGRKAASPLLNSDRGGAIPIPLQDPLAKREAARP
jgi:hypothetical protein